MALNGRISIKVILGEEIRRFVVPKSEPWDGLKNKIEEAFRLGRRNYSLKYVDDDGDDIAIDTQGELLEAFKISEITGVLRIVIKVNGGPCSDNKEDSPSPLREEVEPSASEEETAHHCTKQEKKKKYKEAKKLSKEEKKLLREEKKLLREERRSKKPSSSSCSCGDMEEKLKCEEREGLSGGDELGPPSWFNNHMTELSASLFRKMEHLPNQTISGVLSGLEGFVFQLLSGDHFRSQMPPAVPYIHSGILCDHCNNPIVGVRYKCGNCSDFDLCEFCESQHRVHPEDHIFLKIRRPYKKAGVNLQGQPKPLLRRSIYETLEEQDEEDKDDADLCNGSEGLTSGDSMSVQVGGHAVKKGRLRKKKRLNKIVRIESRMQELVKKLEKLAAEREFESSQDTSGEAVTGCEEAPDMTKKLRPLDVRCVKDANLAETSPVPLCKQFVKRWVVRNSGSLQWRDVSLQHVAGVEPVAAEKAVPDLQPGEELTVEVVFPADCTRPHGQILTSSFRFFFKGNDFENSHYFGERLWLSVVVRDSSTAADPIDDSNITTEEDDCRSAEGQKKRVVGVGSASCSPASVLGQASREEEGGQWGAQRQRLISSDCESSSSPSLVSIGEDPLVDDDSSDEFVIVIPPCFDPNTPLEEQPRCTQDTPTGGEDPAGWLVVPSPDQPPHPLPVDPAHSDSTTPTATSQSSSPRQQPRREQCRFQNRTLGEASIKEPITIATGFVNAFTNFVKDVRVTRPTAGGRVPLDSEPAADLQLDLVTDGEPRPQPRPQPHPPQSELLLEVQQQQQQNDLSTAASSSESEDESFQDASGDAPQHTQSTSAQDGEEESPLNNPCRLLSLSDDNNDLRDDSRRDDQVTESGEKISCAPPGANEASSRVRLTSFQAFQLPKKYTPPLKKWSSPQQPLDQVGRLVSMGFPNRKMNASLLKKHNGHMRAVINELLDHQS